MTLSAGLDFTRRPGDSGVRHLGIVVADLERAVWHYSKIFGLGPWYLPRFVNGENYLRGTETIHTQYAIASAFSRGMEFQLIQVVGGDRDVCFDFLERFGEGVHHAGVYVRNLDERVAEYQAQGFGVLQSGALTSSGKNGAVSKYAYLDTALPGGVVLELIEIKWRGIPLRSSRVLFEFGCLLGATVKLQNPR